MNTKQEAEKFNNFVNEFYSYGKLISAYSQAADDLLSKIKSKQDYFNKLTENQKIEFMNTDSDFQNFQKVVNKLYSAYAQYILFMDQGLKISNETQIVDNKLNLNEVSPSADKTTYESME